LYWDKPHPDLDIHYPASQVNSRPLGADGQVRIGRGPSPKWNDLSLGAKRISNKHCVIYRLDDPADMPGESELDLVSAGKTTKKSNSNGMTPYPPTSNEPIVIIEDLGSSNGTYVNSQRITKKHVLRHGDEVSLGSVGPVPQMNHDVRWIYKSVGKQGVGDEGRVGEIFERFVFLET